MESCLNLRFPDKLWKIINSCKSNSIRWSKDGQSILLFYPGFENEFMSEGKGYFKTTKISSFVRQLNLYGFVKLREKGSSAEKSNLHEFQHQYFVKDRHDLLKFVSRNLKGNGFREETRRRSKQNIRNCKENGFRAKTSSSRKSRVKSSHHADILAPYDDIFEDCSKLTEPVKDGETDLLALLDGDDPHKNAELEATLQILENTQDLEMECSVSPITSAISADWNSDLAAALQPVDLQRKVENNIINEGNSELFKPMDIEETECEFEVFQPTPTCNRSKFNFLTSTPLANAVRHHSQGIYSDVVDSPCTPTTNVVQSTKAETFISCNESNARLSTNSILKIPFNSVEGVQGKKLPFSNITNVYNTKTQPKFNIKFLPRTDRNFTNENNAISTTPLAQGSVNFQTAANRSATSSIASKKISFKPPSAMTPGTYRTYSLKPIAASNKIDARTTQKVRQTFWDQLLKSKKKIDLQPCSSASDERRSSYKYPAGTIFPSITASEQYASSKNLNPSGSNIIRIQEAKQQSCSTDENKESSNRNTALVESIDDNPSSVTKKNPVNYFVASNCFAKRNDTPLVIRRCESNRIDDIAKKQNTEKGVHLSSLRGEAEVAFPSPVVGSSSNRPFVTSTPLVNHITSDKCVTPKPLRNESLFVDFLPPFVTSTPLANHPTSNTCVTPKPLRNESHPIDHLSSVSVYKKGPKRKKRSIGNKMLSDAAHTADASFSVKLMSIPLPHKRNQRVAKQTTENKRKVHLQNYEDDDDENYVTSTSTIRENGKPRSAGRKKRKNRNTDKPYYPSGGVHTGYQNNVDYQAFQNKNILVSPKMAYCKELRNGKLVFFRDMSARSQKRSRNSKQKRIETTEELSFEAVPKNEIKEENGMPNTQQGAIPRAEGTLQNETEEKSNELFPTEKEDLLGLSTQGSVSRPEGPSSSHQSGIFLESIEPSLETPPFENHFPSEMMSLEEENILADALKDYDSETMDAYVKELENEGYVENYCKYGIPFASPIVKSSAISA